MGAASSSTPASEDHEEAAGRQATTTSAESEPDLALHARHLDVRSTQAEPHYLGFSSTFSFSNIVNASLRQNIPARSKPLPGLLPRPSSSPSLCFLPEEELAHRLSTAYFENIQPQYPFLHEPTFRLWERKLYVPQESGDLTLESIPSFFVHMVRHPLLNVLFDQTYITYFTGICYGSSFASGMSIPGRGKKSMPVE